MFRFAKIYPFMVALIIAPGVADKNQNNPVMYEQCQIDEYLKYSIGNTDSSEYIFTSNRTLTDNFDEENFVMRSQTGANFYFRTGESFCNRFGTDGTSEPYFFKPMKLKCEKYGICSEVDNYPKDDITLLVEKYRDMHKLEITYFAEEDDADRLDTRNEFCPLERRIFRPQAGQDEKNDLYYIINTDNHIQKLRTNVCTNSIPEAELKVSHHWEKKCVQEYYYRSLKAINWNGEVINKMFRVPSYCSCVIRKNNNEK